MSSANKNVVTSRWNQYFTAHLRAFMNSLGQLSRSFSATLLTFAVIGIALALPLSLSVLLENVQIVSNSFNQTGQINVFLKPDLSDSELHNTIVVLNLDPNIAKSTYISPEQGLKEFSENAGIGSLMDGLPSNTLPGVIEVSPIKNLSAEKLQSLLIRLKNLPSVTTAQLDMRWLQRLNAIIAIGHRLTILLMVIFAIAVLIIIANTIRLTTQNHKEEILVIKLIGGTNRFIRRPFIYSGVLYGLIGAIIAWFIVDIVITLLSSPISTLASLYGTTYDIQGLGFGATLWLLFGGIVLGWIASWIAVTRYIRQIEPS